MTVMELRNAIAILRSIDGHELPEDSSDAYKVKFIRDPYRTFLQLDDEPKGVGFAHLVIDYSQEHHLLWVVFLDETRECWTFKNSDIRIVANDSMGRPDVGL